MLLSDSLVIRFLLAVLVGLAVESAFAHASHHPKPMHGGQVKEIHGYHVELVVDDEHYLRVYLRQANGVLVPARDVKGSAHVRYADQDAQLALESAGSAYLASAAPVTNVRTYETIQLRLQPSFQPELVVRFRRP